jgi:hypothetical protein
MSRLMLTLALLFLFPTVGFAGKNPADYPLQIQIVESHWHRHNNGTLRGSVNGWGRADVRDGDSIHGFDFTYDALEPFQRTIGDAHYLAKWKKDTVRMELIVGEIGSPDKFHSYDLKTSLRDEVYVPSSEGAKAISQEEYKARPPK